MKNINTLWFVHKCFFQRISGQNHLREPHLQAHRPQGWSSYRVLSFLRCFLRDRGLSPAIIKDMQPPFPYVMRHLVTGLSLATPWCLQGVKTQWPVAHGSSTRWDLQLVHKALVSDVYESLVLSAALLVALTSDKRVCELTDLSVNLCCLFPQRALHLN